jgi:hypothetical protein
MLKRTIQLLALCITLSYTCFGQKDKVVKEMQLRSYLDTVGIWHDRTMNDSTTADDSIVKYDSLFTFKLLTYTQNIPATLKWDFKSLANSINILTSDDGLFRIYSWDNEQDVTERTYTDIIQYKSNKKVYAYLENGYQSEDSPLYCNLFTLKTKHKTYYIVTSHAQVASSRYYDAVKVYTIDTGRANDSVKLFNIDSVLHSSISYEWKSTGQYHTKNGIDYDNTIEYDKNTQSLLIPVVYENGNVSKRFTVYRFDGQYFEKVK